ncbi:hypothetical protein LY78DRAFT_304534 [Colletotrichum sublineola]|nr:hypothetical protein LY78DRAFT_304534 [Colletotrichum sublineola]
MGDDKASTANETQYLAFRYVLPADVSRMAHNTYMSTLRILTTGVAGACYVSMDPLDSFSIPLILILQTTYMTIVYNNMSLAGFMI